jgi:outer membrane protein TolC
MPSQLLKYFVILLFILTALSSSFAKEYKIEELLELAEKNSSNIKSAQYFASSQKNIANQQKYWNNPVMSFDSLSQQSSYSFTQTIPFYNKLQTKFDVEEADFRVLENQKNSLILTVKADVFSLAYQYFALKKKIELAKKRITRLSVVDKYLASVVLNSPTKRAQSIITKDRIKLVERDVIIFNNQLYQTWNLLNIYLGLEEEPKIRIQWLDEKFYRNKNSLIELALENNLELKEQKILISKYKSESNFAKIEQMPDVNISAIAQKNSGSANKDSNGVGVTLSVPLLNQNSEKISATNSKVKAQQAMFEFKKTQLLHLIENDISQYEAAIKIAEIFPIEQIEKIITRLNEANTEFKKGTLDFITYIELDSQEYQNIDGIIDTQLKLANSYAKIMTRIGTFIVKE